MIELGSQAGGVDGLADDDVARFAALGVTASVQPAHLVDDRVVWYAVGDPEGVCCLLPWITHLGKRRGVGLGRVGRWTVEPFDPGAEGWGEGFPVERDGRATRNLPLDWEGARDAEQGFAVVTYPYWEREREELCLVPS